MSFNSPVISPYPMRSAVSQEGGGLRISIPMSMKPFVALFMVVWLGAWTVGGISTARHLLANFDPFEGFWMCGWALGECAVSYSLVRMLVGRDVVQAKNGIIELRKEIFGLGLSKKYSVPEIRNLRFQPALRTGRGGSESRIAFDYGAKTVTFGDGTDEAEAIQLIRIISDQCNLAASQPDASRTPQFWQSH